MRSITQIARFVIKDILRSRWSILNTAFFAAVTMGLFYLQADGAKVAISLASLCLVFVPLISLLYTSMYFYNSRDFIELILTQPISRRSVFLGLFVGILLSLLAAFMAGVGVPYLLFGAHDPGVIISLIVVVFVGCALSAVFAGIALPVAIRFDDKGKGLAVVLGVWLFATIIYDGLVLAGATAFADYPLEPPLLVASVINPVDLVRVLFLVHSDMAALMGYTGAVFVRFFDQAAGITVAVLCVLLWSLAPLTYGARRFARKDF
jgi:Cu-processing system permease protein